MDKPKKRLKRENRTEWSERVVAIQRVTKVVKGGKKMSFRAIIVAVSYTHLTLPTKA